MPIEEVTSLLFTQCVSRRAISYPFISEILPIDLKGFLILFEILRGIKFG